MNRTVVIIQARIKASRLPGKVLLDIGERTVLARVIERCLAIEGAQAVCCAIPESAENDPVAAEAERAGAQVFRGSEADVLGRYYEAAKSLDTDVVLRVTADCPLIDPWVCADVLRLRESADADFADNNTPPGWPHGLDCEAMTFAWLKRAHDEAVDPLDREHVTTYIRRHPDARRVSLRGPGGSLLNHRWTIDYPEDLDFLRALYVALPPEPPITGMNGILAVLDAHLEIAAINRTRHDLGHDPDAFPMHDMARVKGKAVGQSHRK